MSEMSKESINATRTLVNMGYVALLTWSALTTTSVVLAWLCAVGAILLVTSIVLTSAGYTSD